MAVQRREALAVPSPQSRRSTGVANGQERPLTHAEGHAARCAVSVGHLESMGLQIRRGIPDTGGAIAADGGNRRFASCECKPVDCRLAVAFNELTLLGE